MININHTSRFDNGDQYSIEVSPVPTNITVNGMSIPMPVNNDSTAINIAHIPFGKVSQSILCSTNTTDFNVLDYTQGIESWKGDILDFQELFSIEFYRIDTLYCGETLTYIHGWINNSINENITIRLENHDCFIGFLHGIEISLGFILNGKAQNTNEYNKLKYWWKYIINLIDQNILNDPNGKIKQHMVDTYERYGFETRG